ncbi:unnamed protein product [Hymenolepis diminuta]|uniref:BESS domain-containing protein n=1 Tax=Hymenolepis diminuta TaxID=6216 RepID=A0A158QCX7_HYMDI|nr:unnamed protein product [Hymenolepis diminuta]
MESRNSYCFEYLVTKAKMPRKQTCCPFMQRTIYRVTRNLARLDLGFTCPDVEGSGASHASSTATPTLNKRKKKPLGGDHRDSETRARSVGVLSWLVKGTIGRKLPSLNHSDTLSSVPPMESNDAGHDDDTLNDPRIPQTLEMEDETMENVDASDQILLKQKRKLLRRQKIYDMENSLDATTSGNWSEEKMAMPEMESKPIEDSQELFRSVQNKPPSRTVHVKRLHARRISSTSQVGQNSTDQSYPTPPNQNLPSNKHLPLQTTHEVEDWEREGEARDINVHQQAVNARASYLPVQASPPTTTSIIPPFSVREPVEKQVRNWLESTSDEYDILLKR